MMKKIIQFVLVYIFIPLLIIPVLCAKFNNWTGLWAIPFYFVGLFIGKFKLNIFLPIPIAFCLWYWYTYSFTPFDYVFGFFVSLIAGYTIYVLNIEYNRFVHKVLPEQELNDAYDEKLQEMYRRIDVYKSQHPGTKVTQDVIEKIKTEVFFK